MFVNEDIYIEAKLLELQVKDAALTDGVMPEDEWIDSKLTRLQIIIKCCNTVIDACEREMVLWKQVEQCQKWFNG